MDGEIGCEKCNCDLTEYVELWYLNPPPDAYSLVKLDGQVLDIICPMCLSLIAVTLEVKLHVRINEE